MEIDIAVDLAGFTEDCRPSILPHRPAPVQINYLGYAGTMGADYIDYIVGDSTVIPLSKAADYSEKLVHLPGVYLPGGGERRLADHIPSRAEAGLPQTGFVFCAFHHVYKITPPIFDIWMRLLHAVEGSVLWLAQTNDHAANNLKREAVARGIEPERLIFAPFAPSDADHLARLTLAGLFLDAIPYNAHATACDALLAGVPVLTVNGPGFTGRVGASLLNAIGSDEMITSSIDHYERRAIELARDANALNPIKTKLAHSRRNSILFDNRKFARGLERAFIRMWERTQARLSPEGFAVESTS